MADKYRGGDNVTNAKEIGPLMSVPTEPIIDNLFTDLPGDPRSRPVLTATEFSNSSHKKKSTSFQITSVTVQGSRLGNDAGDDSADDLDESHTEDISSDILDCSKTTDVDNELLSSDTSNTNFDDFSMPGIVLPTIQSIPGNNIQVKPSKPTEASVNYSIPLTIGVSADHFTDVSIEPNVATNGVTLVTTTTSPPGVTAQVPIGNSMPDHWQHRFKVVKIVSSEPFKRGRWLCMDFTDPPTLHNENKVEAPEASLQNIDPLTIQNSINSLATSTTDPMDKQNVAGVTRVYEFPINQSIPGSIAVQLNPIQTTSQPVYSILVPVSSIAAANTLQTPTLSTTTAISGVQTGLNLLSQPVSSVAQNVGVQTTPITVISSSAPATNTSTTAVLPNQNSIPVTNIQQPMMGSTSAVSNLSIVSQATNQVPPTTQPLVPASISTMLSGQDTNNLAVAPSLPVNISLQATSHSTTAEVTTSNNNHLNPSIAESSQPLLTAQKSNLEIPPSINNAAAPSNNQSSPLLEMLPDALGTKSLPEGEDSESASAGTSTVAIDNKIEQAMDLVKSHLMFAVREEVDVLKEKITELMDRISQLEVENGILKANASQETLSQLPPSQVNTQNSQNNQTGQPQTVPSSGQLIRPPNANQNQTQTNQQTTNS